MQNNYELGTLTDSAGPRNHEDACRLSQAVTAPPQDEPEPAVQP